MQFGTALDAVSSIWCLAVELGVLKEHEARHWSPATLVARAECVGARLGHFRGEPSGAG
jgi:hypothetical protein